MTRATAVVDTNVLLNLALPVVDGRAEAPSGEDPLLTVLSVYDIHVPDSVLGEVTAASADEDLLAAAAETVLRASSRLTAHEGAADPLGYGLDTGESEAINLANDLGAGLFVTDEFNTTNYLLVSLALDDRNTLFTTPHVLCSLAEAGVLSSEYVDALLTYYCRTKDWERAYVDQLRATFLSG